MLRKPFLLKNLFEEAANAQILSNGEKTPEQKAHFEKYFEEFYSIADQIELNLTTALKCIQQAENSRKYLPLPVTINPQANSWTYEQFVNVAEVQIKHIEEIRSIFSFDE